MDNNEFVITDKEEKLMKNIIIYPNEENVHYFKITNALKYNMEYSIKIKEAKNNKKPMTYRLKENNTYIKNCIDYMELNAKDLKIKSHSQKIYTIEWNEEKNCENERKLEVTVETKKEKNLLILWIILIAIIISLLLLVWKNNYKKPTATLGQKEVNTDNPVVIEDSPTPIEATSPTYSPTPAEIPTPSELGVNNQTTTNVMQPPTQKNTPQPIQPTQPPVIVNKEFIITSNNQKWEENLSIFNNEKYNNLPVIYPGIENTYYFEFTNEKDFDVGCSIEFNEINMENIPIKYALKENGKYIKGNKNAYVNYDELNTKNIIVKANSKNIYELDWKWIDNTKNDNGYGDINKTITYKIEITVKAEEKV